MAKGSCVCGAVEYDITPPYRFFQYCHCSRCRKRSGSAHAANIAVLADQFKWLKGEAHVKRFELSTAKSWSNCFCDTCGSGLPWKTRNGKAFIVPAGSLDDEPQDRPTRNIWYSSRAMWHVDAATLPKFDGEPT
jgi:hypothetical protein